MCFRDWITIRKYFSAYIYSQVWHKSNIVFFPCLSWQQAAPFVFSGCRKNDGISSSLRLFFFNIPNKLRSRIKKIKKKSCSNQLWREVLFNITLTVEHYLYLCLGSCSYSLSLQTGPSVSKCSDIREVNWQLETNMLVVSSNWKTKQGSTVLT